MYRYLYEYALSEKYASIYIYVHQEKTVKTILFIAVLAILSTTSAYAEGTRGGGGYYGGGHGGGWGWGGGWVFPALIGGAIAYDLANPY